MLKNNYKPIIQRVASPDEWIRKFWENYKRATFIKVGPIYITCPNCGRIQKRFFHKEGRFQCSYCGKKGYVNLSK